MMSCDFSNVTRDYLTLDKELCASDDLYVDTSAALFDTWQDSFDGQVRNVSGQWTGDNRSSLNDTVSDDDENVFILTWWQQLVWTLVFSGMIIVATGGNVIVVWIVLTHKRMRSVTNYFLVNLSVADTMVSTLNVTFNFVYMLSRNWIFGDVFCVISNYVAVVSVAASVFTMMAISIDRYIAIMSPLRPRMSRVTTLIITSIIWLMSTVLSIPNLLFTTVMVVPDEDNESLWKLCYMQWPDGITFNSYQEHIYNIAFFIVTYVLPISSMMFTYTRIGHELWGSQSIGECTAKQMESVKNKRRVVKMMIVVVVIFAICWFPYHIYFILMYYYKEEAEKAYIQHIYLGIYWLAMSNSMYNPIIYCWMNARFRHGFKNVFRCCLGIKAHDTVKSVDRTNHSNVRYSCSHSPDVGSHVEQDMLVHISLHTLTEVVCDNGGGNNGGGQSNGLRSTMKLLRKHKNRKPCAV